MKKIIIDNEDKVIIDSSCTVILKNPIVNIEYSFKNDCSVLIFADVEKDLTLNETGKVEGCEVKLNYLQLDNNNLKQDVNIDVYQNANLVVNSTYLGVNQKIVHYNLVNKESNSKTFITNNAVCLKDSDFVLDCVGTIEKGSKHSSCHQKNRCLTMDSPKKAKVLPVLNIDENDVEASHSLSCGTIDEEVLFYMNSRGLNKNESLNLILKSYLMPNDSFYEEFIDGNKIQEKAILKVDTLCSM